MSDESFGFAPPPFRPDEALVQLKRSLRDLKLAERGSGFELKGKRAVDVVVDGDVLRVKLARRLVNTPEWDASVLRSSADQRKLVDEVKKRLERWQRED
jgi:hypothetical protein